MLPISAPRDLAASLLRLEALQEQAEFQKLRVHLADGSVVVGSLATVAAMVGIGALGEWSLITGGALTVFLPLFAAGVLGLRRMERHHWFRRWDTVYQGPRPAPMFPVR